MVFGAGPENQSALQLQALLQADMATVNLEAENALSLEIQSLKGALLHYQVGTSLSLAVDHVFIPL